MEPAPSPTGSTEQPFEVDELFFSATDRKGIITSGNSVFVRVSGYGRGPGGKRSFRNRFIAP